MKNCPACKQPIRKYAEGTPDGGIPAADFNLEDVGQTPDQGVPAALAPAGSPGVADVSQYNPERPGTGGINWPKGTIAAGLADIAKARESGLKQKTDAKGFPIAGEYESPSAQVDSSDQGLPQAPQQSGETAQGEQQAAQPEAQQQEAHTPAPNMYNGQSAQSTKPVLDEEYNKLKQEFLTGKITPQTYSQLYAKKDTLPKIGTIFGLLLGGIGSGLTHQPNVALQMMDKQIDQDLEAQKNNKANQFSALQLADQHHRAEAETALQGLQGKQAQAQTGLINANTEQVKQTTAKTAMFLGAIAHLNGMTNNLPAAAQGPAKAGVQSVLNAVDQHVDQMNAQTAQQMEANWQQQNRTMNFLNPEAAKYEAERHQPGLKGQASVPLSTEDRDKINSGIEFDQKLHRFMDWTKNHSGSLSPSDVNQGQAMAAELQGAYRQATHGGVYKEGEQNFISKVIDSEPTKFFNSIRVMPQLKAVANENQARVNQLVRSKGFQGYQTQQQQSGPEMKTMNGAQYQKVPGGWQRMSK